MTITSEEVRLSATADIDLTTIYETHRPLLIGIAVERFQISHTDAETLAHEIFVAFFLKSRAIRDARTWLLGAMFNACKHYLRQRTQLISLPSEFVANLPDPRLMGIAESLADQMSARQLFQCLTPKCQLALSLRYLDGHTIPEIAAQLRTTPKYAQNLICRCLRQARERYETMVSR